MWSWGKNSVTPFSEQRSISRLASLTLFCSTSESPTPTPFATRNRMTASLMTCSLLRQNNASSDRLSVRTPVPALCASSSVACGWALLYALTSFLFLLLVLEGYTNLLSLIVLLLLQL